MYLIQPTRHLSSFWQKKDYAHFHCFDKFAASQPLGYESCLETPQRYLYTKKLLKTKRAPWRWRYWGGWWPNDSTVFTCAGCMKVSFRKVKQTCIEWLSAWSFSKYVKPPPRFLPFHKDLVFFAPFWCLFLNQAFQTVLNLWDNRKSCVKHRHPWIAFPSFHLWGVRTEDLVLLLWHRFPWGCSLHPCLVRL